MIPKPEEEDLGTGTAVGAVVGQRRKDEPIIRRTKRGKIGLAIEAAASEEGLKRADDELDRDNYAQSALGPRDSLLATWTKLHHLRFRGSAPVLPLTADKIRKVAALFKKAGYRSFANYVSRVRTLHVEDPEGYPVSIQLEHAIKKAIRSATRGIGPSRQTADLLLEDIFSLDISDSPLVSGGPVGPKEMAVCACFFCCREIESSLAKADHISLDETRMEMKWRLPATKKDPTAIGTTMTWGCTCRRDLEEGKQAPCPYHAWVTQLGNLKRRFGDLEGNLPEHLRAFPDEAGATVPKEKVVETAECLATLTNRPLVSVDGDRLYGGHVWRISGARHLATLGLALWLIQLIARWSSDVILRYVREAPLAQVTQEYRRRFLEKQGQDHMEELSRALGKMQQSIKDLEAKVESGASSSSSSRPESRPLTRVDSVEQYRRRLTTKLDLAESAPRVESRDLESLKARVEELESESRSLRASQDAIKANVADWTSRLDLTHTLAVEASFPKIIISGYRVAHKPARAGLGIMTREWKARCGWEFGLSEYHPASTLPVEQKYICSGCFPLDKMAAQPSSDESSSSGSGSDTS